MVGCSQEGQVAWPGVKGLCWEAQGLCAVSVLASWKDCCLGFGWWRIIEARDPTAPGPFPATSFSAPLCAQALLVLGGDHQGSEIAGAGLAS